MRQWIGHAIDGDVRCFVGCGGRHGAIVCTGKWKWEEKSTLSHPFRPEIVLCDIGLPVMNGYELARQRRQQGMAPINFSWARLC